MSNCAGITGECWGFYDGQIMGDVNFYVMYKDLICSSYTYKTNKTKSQLQNKFLYISIITRHFISLLSSCWIEECVSRQVMGHLSRFFGKQI